MKAVMTFGPRRRTSSTDDLASLKKEQFNLRFQKATGQLEKTGACEGGPQGHRAHQDDRGAKSRRASKA